MNKPLLCLNMIVKNEANIIENTLMIIISKVPIDYWVISDTGSTDGTQDIIKSFFNFVGIKGELYEDKWVDFAYNRTKALEYAYNKSKYLMVFDADDKIIGNITLPKELTKDGYNYLCGYGV
jgi:glycosyltransferase involved in cell wall biosynthesis